MNDHTPAANSPVIIYLEVPPEKPARICIPSENEWNIVCIADIVRCEAQRNYTAIHLNDGRRVLSSKTLGHFGILLAGHDFFRVHHGHLVNLAFVQSFRKKKKGYIVVVKDAEVAVSARRREAFLTCLKEL